MEESLEICGFKETKQKLERNNFNYHKFVFLKKQFEWNFVKDKPRTGHWVKIVPPQLIPRPQLDLFADLWFYWTAKEMAEADGDIVSILKAVCTGRAFNLPKFHSNCNLLQH